MLSYMLFGVGNGSLRSVGRLLHAGRDRRDHWLRLWRNVRAHGLALLSLIAAVPAFAQHAQTVRYEIPEGGGTPVPVVITIVKPPVVGSYLGELRGATENTVDAGFGEQIIPCTQAQDIGATERFGCYESRYSIKETCQLAAAAGQGCVISFSMGPGESYSADGCVEGIRCNSQDNGRWRGGRACSFAHKFRSPLFSTIAVPELTDSPYVPSPNNVDSGRCEKYVNADLRLYNRVYNYCQRRWESLDCAWCNRSAFRGGCNRYCDGLVITCTQRMTCRDAGGCRLPSAVAPDKEGWLDRNGDLKCLSSLSDSAGGTGSICKPEFAEDGDEDGDGYFDEGDTVEGKIKFSADCDPSSSADLANPECYVMFCPSGSSQVYTGVSVPGASVRPRCKIDNACEFNQDLTGINGNCGCPRGAVWEGDRCNNNGDCPAGKENVNGICQCPSGQVDRGDGTCVPIDLSGVSPFSPVAACSLDAENSRWVIDRLGNTIGSAFIGVYNNTYNPACSLLINKVAFFGVGTLRQRLEGYGAGTCPVFKFGSWSVGGEVLVRSDEGWHKPNSRRTYRVADSGFICDWLDKQREMVGRVMVFIFNMLALANLIGRRNNG